MEVSSELTDRARDLRVASAQHIRDILISHRSNWSVGRMSLNTVQFATIALRTLLEELDDVDSCQAPVDLCVILRTLARRWQLAKTMLQHVKMNFEVPQEVRCLFKDINPLPAQYHSTEQYSIVQR